MDLSPWYCVCTKAVFISKGSYGYGEARNVFAYSVQSTLLPVLAVKLLHFKGVGIGPRTEICMHWDGPIAMVPYVHQGNIYIKKKQRVWIDQKCIPVMGVKSPLTCAGRETTPSQGSRYWPDNRNLPKLGWTYHHGTVFAPIQYLYPKKATGMERPEMYSPSWCENPSYLCRLSN